MRGSSPVWAALARARADNLKAAGRPAPVAGDPGHTRRQVLKALAAASAVAALPRPAHAVPITGPVAVVGGGIAGLTALWTLTRAGIDAHLFEARPRLGGRMYTWRNGALAMEIGGQLVNTDHADMHALAKAFGVDLIDRKDQAHQTAVLADGKLLSQDELASGLRRIAGQIDRDSARLDADYDKVAAELDRLSFAGYLNRHNALMQPWTRRLMETTARTEYGVEPAQASAIELIFNLPSVDGERIDVLGRSDERYLIAGGSGALIEAMAATLASRITTDAPVRRIDALGGRGGGGVRIGFGAARAAQTFGAVIVATPAGITREIGFGVPLPALWRAYLQQVRLGRNGKILMKTSSRPWELTFGRGGELWQCDPAHGFALGWDSQVRPASDGGSVWTWFLGGSELDQVGPGATAATAAALARKFANAGEPAMPGIGKDVGFARATTWHHEPYTRGGYVNYAPGQLTRFAPVLWVEEKGRVTPPLAAGPVWFAGEHLSDAYPGYMNGGAQTGRLAAQELIAAMAIKAAA